MRDLKKLYFVNLRVPFRGYKGGGVCREYQGKFNRPVNRMRHEGRRIWERSMLVCSIIILKKSKGTESGLIKHLDRMGKYNEKSKVLQKCYDYVQNEIK